MFLTTRQTLDIYDFLLKHVPRETAVQLLERHVVKNQVVVEMNGTGVLGMAVCWQIDDPNDVDPKRLPEIPECSGENAMGKYAYLPFILVKPECRMSGVLTRLLGRCLEHCPGAKRIAFRRNVEVERKKRFGSRHPSRLHIIEVKDAADKSH